MATQYAKRNFLMVVVGTLLFLSIFTITYASTTVGTNLSTTGTFTQTVGSATAARFQNAAGSNTLLTIDTTNWRVGIGGTPQTMFEVQGTASASYFLTGNTLQVGGFSSAAYSRFGTNTTTSNFLTTSNDLLISGKFEVDGSASFDRKIEVQGTASASYFLTGNTIQVNGFASAAYSRFGTNTTGSFLTNANDLLISGRLEVDASVQFDKTIQVQGTASASYFLTENTIQVGGNASVAYSRFGTTATSHVGTISTTTDLMVGGGFEVNGSAAFDGFALFSAKASVTTNFEANGYASSNDKFVSRNLIVGHRAASSSSKYAAEFGGGNNTATVSLLFGGNAPSSAGTCLQMKNTAGNWVYLRVKDGTSSASLVISTKACHQ